jgi:hypothetical protein
MDDTTVNCPETTQDSKQTTLAAAVRTDNQKVLLRRSECVRSRSGMSLWSRTTHSTFYMEAQASHQHIAVRSHDGDAFELDLFGFKDFSTTL